MNILLAVTGSISCYKSFDLLRLFIKDGHQVKVITTSGAEKFLKIELYRYLGAIQVYSSIDDFNTKKLQDNSTVTHIELTKWADHFVIAPLSANTLSNLVSGSANDLLTSAFLAYPKNKPISIFPAMNSNMLTHPFVEKTLKLLIILITLMYTQQLQACLHAVMKA